MTEFVGSFQVGEIRVSMISDGVSMAPRGPSWFTGIDPAEWMPAIGVDDPDTLLPVNFGAFVIESEGHVTLVDSGFGERAATVPGMQGAGRMLDQLATLGIEPHDVNRIVQTHLHADHCGWLIRATDDPELIFPNAEVVVHRDEVAYWRSAEADSNLAPAYTRARLEAVADAGLLTEIACEIDGEVDLGGGVGIIPSPGHTPGHISVMVTSGDRRALLLGDVAHHCIHLEQHTWLQNYDVDPQTSIATRGRLAALAVDQDAVVTAPHMPVLTLLRLERDGAGFRYHPA